VSHRTTVSFDVPFSLELFSRSCRITVSLALASSMCVTGAEAQALLEREQAVYLTSVQTVYLHLGLHNTFALPHAEDFCGICPPEWEKATPLSPVSEQTLQELWALRRKLTPLDKPFLGYTDDKWNRTRRELGLSADPLSVGWARNAFASGHEALKLALQAIEAYERSYAETRNRHQRLQARSLNCGFLEKLDQTVRGTPQLLISRGMLSQEAFEARMQSGSDVLLEKLGKAKEWVCKPVSGVPPAVAGSPKENPLPRSKRPQSTRSGTGFLVHPEGRLLTALHVVKGASKIEVLCPDSASSSATIERSSEVSDLAILKTVPAGRSAYLSFEGTDTLELGTYVFTVGFPAPDILGTEPKFTEGSVTALSGPGGHSRYLQVTIPIQPGNSGGPVLNSAGAVVGIVTSTIDARAFVGATGSLPQNVNWAVKSEYGAMLLEGTPRRPTARNRSEAIRRAQAATCLIRSEPD